MSSDPTSTILAGPGDPAPRARFLVVIGPEGPQGHRLPTQGSWIVGRGDDADVVLSDAQVSRQHVRLHLGATLEIEDLGSANGSTLDGTRLASGARVAWRSEQRLQIGATLLLIHHFSESRARPRLRTHAYFEARLEDECAKRGGPIARSPFGLLRFSAVGAGAEDAIIEVLESSLRSADVAAMFGPEHYEVLLLDSVKQRVDGVVKALEAALKKRDCWCAMGAAYAPEDGITADQLLEHASARLEGETQAPRAAPIIEAPAMKALYQLVDRVAPSPLSVLLLGETGAGKEVVAEAIHQRSGRKGAYVRINCAALSEQLVESELFGHEKGAFTGADAAKPGQLELADGGTILLDEVGELPAGTQAKLLRALETKQILRVGGTAPRAIDTRVVAATNRDLATMVEAGSYRADLYYRLNGISLVVPPLRERVSEILPLAHAFAERFARLSGWTLPSFTPEACALLSAYRWPGNVRELKNAIERAVLLAADSAIDVRHLPLEKIAIAPVEAALPKELASKRARVVEALERCGGNQKRAAEQLGVSRQTLSKWMYRVGLPKPRKKG